MIGIVIIVENLNSRAGKSRGVSLIIDTLLPRPYPIIEAIPFTSLTFKAFLYIRFSFTRKRTWPKTYSKRFSQVKILPGCNL